VELLAIVPVLLVCAVVAAHALPTGWALWSAADAARSGARAEHIGADPERAARGALPGSTVRSDDEGVSVRVEVPALLPGMRERRIGAAARLEPGGS
jgi:hypothetical protein